MIGQVPPGIRKRFDPESIEESLFALITKSVDVLDIDFRTMTRNSAKVNEPAIADLPGLWLIPFGGPQDQKQAYGTSAYTLLYEVVIRTTVSADLGAPPAQTMLNRCWAAIDAAMESIPPGERQTLGGLVNHAWIEGPVLLQPGIAGRLAGIEIPIKVNTGMGISR